MRNKCLCMSVLRVASGPRVKLVDCQSARNPTVVYTADHSKAVVRLLFLLCVALWFILQGDSYCFALCFFCHFVFLSC